MALPHQRLSSDPLKPPAQPPQLPPQPQLPLRKKSLPTSQPPPNLRPLAIPQLIQQALPVDWDRQVRQWQELFFYCFYCQLSEKMPLSDGIVCYALPYVWLCRRKTTRSWNESNELTTSVTVGHMQVTQPRKSVRGQRGGTTKRALFRF